MTKNKLAGEKSPYLLQHADNPVHWQPWGETAFAAARAEDKPIFLSIGYSTCHWCHVMAHESFENTATAEIMNRHFINIKVDREERPDVDRIYMAFVQATTGSGGWPMSVWLTPELKPFYGGTYFPPESRYGRAGFPDVLTRIAQLWREEREKVHAQGQKMVDALAQMAAFERGAESVPEVAEQLTSEFLRSYDVEEGGFGAAPKFPRPSALVFLLRQPPAHEAVLHTLRKMAMGGMNDQLGGGFHRYSVDRFWHVPHFEKMLYDQAQLVVAYLEAFQITGEEVFAETARGTLNYVLRDLAHEGGGFYSAEDADSLLEYGSQEHAEGAFYVWTREEILQCLGEATGAEFCNAYGVTPGGNAPEGSDPMGEFTGKNILVGTGAVNGLAKARETLFSVREARPRPHRDDKILTAWNGLMLSALARGFQLLGDSAYVEAAVNTVGFLKQNMTGKDTGHLKRSWRQGAGETDGFAEDYAFLIQGLLDLYEATFDPEWLQWALELQQNLDARFAEDQAGYFNTAADAGDMLVRMKEDHDGAEPSANSVAALNLIRLWRMTGREELRERAGAVVKAFSGLMESSPMAMPLMVVAAGELKGAAPQILLAGGPEGEVELLAEIHKRFLPGRILLRAEGLDELSRLPYLKSIRSAAHCEVYLCEHNTCRLPVSTAEELAKLLK